MEFVDKFIPIYRLVITVVQLQIRSNNTKRSRVPRRAQSSSTFKLPLLYRSEHIERILDSATPHVRFDELDLETHSSTPDRLYRM